MTISATTQGIKPGVCTSTNRPSAPFDGQVIYMTDVDQTAVWDGTQWTVLAPIASGRNRIINGDFKVWQRGTSYTVAPANYGAADRYIYWHNGSTNGTNTVSRQTFTPGAAPVAGYESEFFQRITTTTLGTGQTVIDCWQRIENVRTLAGQSVTVSFWAKTSGTFTMTCILGQNFGSGGSASVDTSFFSAVATSGSWTRYTGTATLPSISGKTVGSGSYVNTLIRFNAPTAGATFDLWGVQVEAGAVSTPFEFEDYGTTLEKCQRYFQHINDPQIGGSRSTAQVQWAQNYHRTMRSAPTFTLNGLIAHNLANGANLTLSALGLVIGAGLNSAWLYATNSGTGTTAGVVVVYPSGSPGGLYLSAEL